MLMCSSGTAIAVLLCLPTALASAAGSGAAGKPFFCKPLVLGAHRGGRLLWPENTLEAFKNAAARWPDALLEGDAQLTADGHVVLLHDKAVDRTTNGTGPVAEMTLAEVKALDAGYRFTRDHGQTFPYRGKGIVVPTLAEVLRALPDSRFLIELKLQTGVAEPTVKVLEEADALDRVAVASISVPLMNLARRLAPNLICCYDLNNGIEMLNRLRQPDWASYEPTADILAINEDILHGFKLEPDDLEALRRKGITVLMHTINSADRMRHLLDAGVASVLSDRPDLLSEVLAERGASGR